MTIHDPDADRVVRPMTSRTDPKRNILRAVRQNDGRGQEPREEQRFADDGVWGAAAADAGLNGNATDWLRDEVGANGAGAGWDPRPLWDSVSDGVKAAYDVIDQQIREGQAAADRLNRSQDGPQMRSIPSILNRLVQSYSDLGAVWLDLLSVASERDFGLGQQAGPAPQAAAPSTIAVEVTASGPVTARARLYRAVRGPLTVLPLRGTGGGEITGVSADAGPVVRIEVPAGTAPGDYHGIVLEDGAEEPAGSVTLRIPPGA